MTPPIVFCQEVGGSQQLCAVDFDGTGFAQLTADANDYNWARWSKDGTQILAADSSNRLWIFTAEGALVRQITNFTDGGSTGYWQGDWSPDGSQIVILGTEYGTGGSATADLQIVNADNSGSVPVALAEQVSLYGNSIISWSPDNTRFLYTGTNPDHTYPSGVNYGVVNATTCLLDGSSPVHIFAGAAGPPRRTYVPWRWYADSTNILVVEQVPGGPGINRLLKSDGTTTTTLYTDATDDVLDAFANLGAMDPTETKFAANDITSRGLLGISGGIASEFYTSASFVSSDGLDWGPSAPPPAPAITTGTPATGIIRLG